MVLHAANPLMMKLDSLKRRSVSVAEDPGSRVMDSFRTAAIKMNKAYITRR
jgi:hypothetical protein